VSSLCVDCERRKYCVFLGISLPVLTRTDKTPNVFATRLAVTADSNCWNHGGRLALMIFRSRIDGDGGACMESDLPYFARSKSIDLSNSLSDSLGDLDKAGRLVLDLCLTSARISAEISGIEIRGDKLTAFVGVIGVVGV